MASETLGADESSIQRPNRWGKNSKVYTRKIHNKRPLLNTTTTTTSTVDNDNNNTTVPSSSVVATTTTASSPNNNNNDENNGNTAPEQQSSQTLATEDANQSQQEQTQLVVVSDDSSTHQNRLNAPNGNGIVKPIITKVDDRVRINLGVGRPKNEIRELKRKLVNELDQVRILVKKLETKEDQITGYSIDGGYSHLQYLGSEGRALERVNSEVGYYDSMPFRHLNVSVMDNNHGVHEIVEKEKRTPKANQYYRNSEFLLGKDRLPPAESNKKLKSNGGKKHGRGMGHGFGMGKYTNQVFKNCSNLLTRLMKHKHGWVFNEPVDARALGLHDYHDIIKHPMDLGTIKTRLSKNWYKSPREFAEDVRLTFDNAMTYNPKGQDVHVMADELSKIFEEKWAVIESEYNFGWRYELVHDVGLPTPTSRKVHPSPPQPQPVFEVRNLEGRESMTGMMPFIPVNSKLKPHARVGRTPVPKKPKVNDPHKRDMTYEEKQRLSTNLQNLPAEKLDNIVQIIKKRNSAVSQNDDEIEVDIDNVDAETLWELDRFVTNYKKSLSKIKRRAELALQARGGGTPAVPALNPTSTNAEAPKDSKIDEKNASNSSPAQGGRLGDNVSRSSSSSSSSSDSDSSSSDSDSDSSSECDSDAAHSPRT